MQRRVIYATKVKEEMNMIEVKERNLMKIMNEFQKESKSLLDNNRYEIFDFQVNKMIEIASSIIWNIENLLCYLNLADTNAYIVAKEENGDEIMELKECLKEKYSRLWKLVNDLD